MYFNNFPSMAYSFKIGGKDKYLTMRDITTNVRYIRSVMDKIMLFDMYHIQDGDTPEIISERAYGSPNYNWALMIFNYKYDYVKDWPVPESVLSKYVDSKYGVGNRNAVHHYVLDGYVVDSTAGGTPVSNYNYEVAVNDAKRTLKMVHPNIMKQLANQIVDTLK